MVYINSIDPDNTPVMVNKLSYHQPIVKYYGNHYAIDGPPQTSYIKALRYYHNIK